MKDKPKNPLVVFDIETSGPVPNPYSMLSLGAVRLDGNTLEEQDRFYMKFRPMYLHKCKDTDLLWHDHYFDQSTYDWWMKQDTEVFAEVFRNAINPNFGMHDFVRFVVGPEQVKKVTLLCKPATFDGSFVNHYSISAGYTFEELPWKHRIMDLASWMAGRYGIDYHDHGRLLPKVEGHDHHALHDAIALAEQFRRMALG